MESDIPWTCKFCCIFSSLNVIHMIHTRSSVRIRTRTLYSPLFDNATGYRIEHDLIAVSECYQ